MTNSHLSMISVLTETRTALAQMQSSIAASEDCESFYEIHALGGMLQITLKRRIEAMNSLVAKS